MPAGQPRQPCRPRSRVTGCEVVHEEPCDIDTGGVLKPLPAGNTVDLEHVGYPIRPLEEVDPGILSPNSGRRAHRKRRVHVVGSDGGSGSASSQVGPPATRAPLDGTDNPAPQDEEPQIGPAVLDGALQVEDTANLLDGAKHAKRQVRVAYSHHAQSHGAEQRLDYNISKPMKCGESFVDAVADNRLRCRQPTLLQQG